MVLISSKGTANVKPPVLRDLLNVAISSAKSSKKPLRIVSRVVSISTSLLINWVSSDGSALRHSYFTGTVFFFTSFSGLLSFSSSMFFCEVVTESGCHPIVHDDPELTRRLTPYGYFDSEKAWRPFLMCVIPMIIIYPSYDDYMRDAGFDMFDDVIDTSFYKIEDLDEKNRIIKNNLEVIENDLTTDGRFRDNIWDRLKRNQEYFLDFKNYYKYVWGKMNG